MEILKNYINGEWIESVTGRTREITCPSDGTLLAYTTESNKEDAKTAIAAAKKAFYEEGTWRKMAAVERASYLLKIADLMEDNQEELDAIYADAVAEW